MKKPAPLAGFFIFINIKCNQNQHSYSLSNKIINQLSIISSNNNLNFLILNAYSSTKYKKIIGV